MSTDSIQVQQLRRRLIEANRWREVLKVSYRTIENHSPENSSDDIRSARLADCKQRLADLDLQINRIDAELCERTAREAQAS
jgi:hypothetical protein